MRPTSTPPTSSSAESTRRPGSLFRRHQKASNKNNGGNLSSVVVPAAPTQRGSFIPQPPSPPATRAGSPSNLDHTEPPKRNHRIKFFESVAVRQTWAAEDYDRSTIQVTPLTRDEITDILKMRAQMHQQTITLYRQRHLREVQEMQAARMASAAETFFTRPVSSPKMQFVKMETITAADLDSEIPIMSTLNSQKTILEVAPHRTISKGPIRSYTPRYPMQQQSCH
ncbi:hypothetical protein DFS34DRAFT_647512 [Phlyctochytrium arcticum]|nr:hypothetical protein DFS34DRAFT_647512 [Phlyctochytrium arcticum]